MTADLAQQGRFDLFCKALAALYRDKARRPDVVRPCIVSNTVEINGMRSTVEIGVPEELVRGLRKGRTTWEELYDYCVGAFAARGMNVEPWGIEVVG